MLPMRVGPGGMTMVDPAALLWSSLLMQHNQVNFQAILPSPPPSVKEAPVSTAAKVEITTSKDAKAIVPKPVGKDVQLEAPAGFLLIDIKIGARRLVSVVCCRENGFAVDEKIEIAPSLLSALRSSPSGNLDGASGALVRALRAGEELTLSSSASLLLPSPMTSSSSRASSSPKGSENGEGFSCERCGKVFSYEYYRDKHLKYTRCVDQGDRKFPCPICPRSFEKRDRLRIHVLHVHENHRPHACSVCSKSFSQSSSLNKHLRVHSGERPYQCPYCTKSFTASSILRTHIRQHSGEKPFKCCHCGKAFASHAAHDSHVRRTHAVEPH
ncbi:hypothetical protein PFISCL1PPCAC_22579 [Pristionchus fissidentatus]|uniref:C2H2-type domain-containing protein n=1 Tax=Pristionchus fissidentatus TaxID=1538716 RepID=A0AAV5WHB3_9BILA|nr:hypothetical protein PFISCL1PPCAC_22579 [Pristionchus fissidentatus]